MKHKENSLDKFLLKSLYKLTLIDSISSLYEKEWKYFFFSLNIVNPVMTVC